MPSAGDSWSAIIRENPTNVDDHLICLAETSPTSDAKKIWNENWSEDYGSEMEPTNSQEMSGAETISTGRIPEGPDVVKKKRCLIYKLPPGDNVHFMVSGTYSQRGKLDLAFAAN